MFRHLRLVLLIALLTSAGCSAKSINHLAGYDSGQAASTPSQPQITLDSPAEQTLVVFAAASLTDAFQQLGKEFESTNPGVRVQFNFTGSQIARMQIEQGAKADIFASADHKNMDVLVSNNLVDEKTYQDFATNQLVVIVPRGNPADVQSLNDLATPGVKLILADASVPAGNYARQVLTKMSEDPQFGPDFMAKVLANVVSNETDVRQVVTKIELGEADAGIVYVSDAVANPNLVEIAIPSQFNVIASYPMAVLVDAPNPLLAEAFILFVLSPSGQAIMKQWGFAGAP